MQHGASSFYYHYKHDPSVDVANCAYEVIGLAQHTEEEMSLIVYRPLYPCDIKLFARPQKMFLEDVRLDLRPTSQYHFRPVSRFSPVPEGAVLSPRRYTLKERDHVLSVA